MGLNFKILVIWKALSTMPPKVSLSAASVKPSGFGNTGSKVTATSVATPAAAHPPAHPPAHAVAHAVAPAAAHAAAPAAAKEAAPVATSVAPSSAPTVAPPKVPPKPQQCAEFNRTKQHCHRGKGCRDQRCVDAFHAAAATAPPKSSRNGGDGGVAAAMAAMEKRLSERLDTIETKVESGFAAQQAAEDRLQRSIEAMMGGIGGLARTIEGGIASSRSTAALPAPETHGSARRPPSALPALPAPPALPASETSGLTNFARVAALLKDCPLNTSVKALIPAFVKRYPSFNPDALACLLLAILSGKKVSDLKKMGEFTRTMVLPLLTQANMPYFRLFFEELAPKCKPGSCVRVNDSKGSPYEQTFHLLGKEETDMLYLIKILLEEA